MPDEPIDIDHLLALSTLTGEAVIRGDQMSATELCDRCRISLSRLKYLKQEGFVSDAKGARRYAYYTDVHERQVRTAEQLARKFGGLAKVREAMAQERTRRQVQRESPGGLGYAIERVYRLRSGIKIVVPELIGSLGTAQLNRILAAAENSEDNETDLLFEELFTLIEQGERFKSRPTTKIERKRASSLPSE